MPPSIHQSAPKGLVLRIFYTWPHQDAVGVPEGRVEVIRQRVRRALLEAREDKVDAQVAPPCELRDRGGGGVAAEPGPRDEVLAQEARVTCAGACGGVSGLTAASRAACSAGVHLRIPTRPTRTLSLATSSTGFHPYVRSLLKQDDCFPGCRNHMKSLLRRILDPGCSSASLAATAQVLGRVPASQTAGRHISPCARSPAADSGLTSAGPKPTVAPVLPRVMKEVPFWTQWLNGVTCKRFRSKSGDEV